MALTRAQTLLAILDRFGGYTLVDLLDEARGAEISELVQLMNIEAAGAPPDAEGG